MGSTEYANSGSASLFNGGYAFQNMSFFTVFAIVFPAFTGMTAGVGLSGDLKNPGRSIPIGTVSATLFGMLIYFAISYKLAISASPEDLINNQLVMSDIALFGPIIIPLGLAASTLSSAIGSILVAPRTLQALGTDNSLPFNKMNSIVAKGVGETKEPYNATGITAIIALVFVAMGDVNAVAQIISMFFMVTYGSICLISFLHHFGADPSYRPVFKSRWYFSLIGFVMCVWLMFKISTPYAVAAIAVMVLLYILTNNTHKERGGMEQIFQGAVFQLSRTLHVFIQKSKKTAMESKWRPSAICVSDSSFDRHNAIRLLEWISHKNGFGTYIHLIEGYFSKNTCIGANKLLDKLIEHSNPRSKVYLDTIISPSYTTAIAQIIQLPSISGLETNMMIFEFDKENPSNLKLISENIALVRAGHIDICVLGSSRRPVHYRNGIHVWIRSHDVDNANLMILLSYIILSHPSWKNGKMKIFDICKPGTQEETRKNLLQLIEEGRLPIAKHNLEILSLDPQISARELICSKSEDAGLTVVGFLEDHLRHNFDLFTGYDKVGDILFVSAAKGKAIS